MKNVILKTKYFSDNIAKKVVGNTAGAFGGFTGATLGAGAGYVGGRLAGKLAVGNKEDFIQKYLGKHPQATRQEAEIAYKQKRGTFNKIGTLAGTVGGAIGGFKALKGGAGKLMGSKK